MTSSTMVSASACLPYGLEGDKFSTKLELSTALDPRIISGALGSVVSGLVVTPFEVAKVKQQNYYYTRTLAQARNTLLPPPPQPSSSGVLSTIRHVIATEGIRGAYAGLAPTLIMAVPNYVLFLLITDEMDAYLRTKRFDETAAINSATSPPTVSENAIPFVAGAVARLIASTAIAPLEMLRTRAASLTKDTRRKSQSSLSGVGRDLYTTIKKNGVGALYKGLVPTLGRDVPFAAIYMVCLERFRDASRSLFLLDKHEEQGGHHHISTCNYSPQIIRQAGYEFTNAALAGMVAASCTAPLDVVKTRLQSDIPGQRGQSTLQVLKSIVGKEGLVGLWMGNRARMMKVAPQYAIMISFYEMGKKILA